MIFPRQGSCQDKKVGFIPPVCNHTSSPVDEYTGQESWLEVTEIQITLALAEKGDLASIIKWF